MAGGPDGTNGGPPLNPTDRSILALMTEGRDRGEPWGYATPAWLADELDTSRQNVSDRLTRFREHGVMSRPATGFYRLERDPRDGDN